MGGRTPWSRHDSEGEGPLARLYCYQHQLPVLCNSSVYPIFLAISAAISTLSGFRSTFSYKSDTSCESNGRNQRHTGWVRCIHSPWMWRCSLLPCMQLKDPAHPNERPMLMLYNLSTFVEISSVVFWKIKCKFGRRILSVDQLLRTDCFQASTTFLEQFGCTALHPNTIRGA